MKFIKGAGLIVGVPLVSLIAMALVALVVRFVMIEVQGPAVDEEHLANKQAYLDSLENSLESADSAPFNLVVIFFDDLGWGDLSSYGNQFIDTPHIDNLAEQGLRMTNFYSASPVCTPSRAALLTGRFPPRTRTDRHVFFNDRHAVGIGRRMLGLANELPKEEITLPEILQRVGYRTHMVGKWHLGSREDYRPTDFGFDHWYGVLYSNDMYPLDLYDDDNIVIKDEREGGAFSAERDELRPLPGKGIDQTQLTRMYTDKAVEFLEAEGSSPFFLYVAHSLPHVPHYASQAFAGTSKGGTYGDVVEDLDRSTGAIIAALDRLGLAENTLVIVTSDNGADYTGSAGPLRGRKQEILEGGQRVPMIARWPRQIPAGLVTDAMAMNTDLLPTVLDLLSIAPPKDRVIDGLSIVDTLKSGSASHDRLYYFPTTDPLPSAIRSKEFKLTWEMDDVGRAREHLSRMSGAEAHDVMNLYPEAFQQLRAELAEKRNAVAENPRGWQAD